MRPANRCSSRTWGAIALATSIFGLPATAHGAFPGENGRIAFPSVQLRLPQARPLPPGRDSDLPKVVSSRLVTVRGDGRGRRTVHAFPREAPNFFDNEFLYKPVWSPDGRWLAFEERARLVIMRSDGTGLRRLPRQTEDDGAPAWSPAGRRLVFEGLTPPPDLNRGLYTVHTDRTGLRLVQAGHPPAGSHS